MSTNVFNGASAEHRSHSARPDSLVNDKHAVCAVHSNRKRDVARSNAQTQLSQLCTPFEATHYVHHNEVIMII